jgi:hypothetical protein
MPTDKSIQDVFNGLDNKEIKQRLFTAANAINHITVINLEGENDSTLHRSIHTVRNKLAEIERYIDEKEIRENEK